MTKLDQWIDEVKEGEKEIEGRAFDIFAPGPRFEVASQCLYADLPRAIRIIERMKEGFEEIFEQDWLVNGKHPVGIADSCLQEIEEEFGK